LKTFYAIFFLLIHTLGILSAATYTISPETVSEIRTICQRAQGGDTIYLRGGVYTRPFPLIRCRGDAHAAITLTARPGEQVTIRVPWRVRGAYLHITGLNFRGESDRIDYRTVIEQWWNPGRKIRTMGLFVRGHHIRITDNTIGYFPASGIKITGESDYLSIRHNIIYNNAWWSTGGTGGLIVKNIHEFDPSTATKVTLRDNLLFGNESRIISHVFKKGFTKMTIDEGESFLIQQKDDPRKRGAEHGVYHGRYRVENNLILFNGKGSSLNKAARIDMIANTLYCNGTTAQSPNAGGIRGNHTDHDTFIDNAIESCGDDRAISVIGEDNRFEGNIAKSSNQKPLPGLTLVDHLFRDPQHLDFASRAFGDRANKLLKSFEPMLRRNHITVRPTGYRVDLPRQIRDIIARIPQSPQTKIEKSTDRITIHLIDNRGIKGLPEEYVLKF